MEMVRTRNQICQKPVKLQHPDDHRLAWVMKRRSCGSWSGEFLSIDILRDCFTRITGVKVPSIVA
jgi:hypothetical protein